MREIIVLGGCNGAGKTSTAKRFFKQELGTREFVNADEIAHGLSPFNPEAMALQAGRLMIDRMRELVRLGQSFALETTCSGQANLKFIRRCKDDGWRITVLFLWLPSPQHAIDRVAYRVSKGGHSIPRDVIIRRYWSGLDNFRRFYLPLADIVVVYRNPDEGPVYLAEKRDGKLTIHDEPHWRKLLGASP